MLKSLAIALSAAMSIGAAAQAADITGAGATFPAPVYAKWAEAYKKETGVGLNYQAIGSGGGVRQINARTVNFGASDKPPSRTRSTKPAWCNSRPWSAGWCR